MTRGRSPYPRRPFWVRCAALALALDVALSGLALWAARDGNIDDAEFVWLMVGIAAASTGITVYGIRAGMRDQ